MTAGSVSLVVVARVRRGLVCGGAAAGVCLLLAGCAGPVLDYGGYRHAALNTAMAMVSSLTAAQLAVQDDLRGRNLRMPFQLMEQLFGLLGLGLIDFVVALFHLPTNWAALWHQASHPGVPAGQSAPTWWFYAISLIGACLIPYQVIFFTSGGREEQWTTKSLGEMRLNAIVGFPLGGLLSLAIMAVAVPVLQPRGIQVSHLDQVALPVATALGKIGLALVAVSFFAAVFAASAEAALSAGYSVAQYFGWSWGKEQQPSQAARFHLVCLASLIAATAFIRTTVDPITVTIVSVVLGAAAIPLTYFPVLIVANDARYMGRWVNRRWVDAAGTLFLLIMVVVSVVTVPLIFLTKAGQ